MRGVVEFCKTCREIYPGTNVVAGIRHAAWELLSPSEQIQRLYELKFSGTKQLKAGDGIH